MPTLEYSPTLGDTVVAQAQAWIWQTLPGVSGINHDVALKSACVRVGLSGPAKLTGFDKAAFDDGSTDKAWMVWLVNESDSSSLTLAHDTGSAAGNRIWTPSGADYVVAPYSQAFLIFNNNVTGREGWWLFM